MQLNILSACCLHRAFKRTFVVPFHTSAICHAKFKNSPFINLKRIYICPTNTHVTYNDHTPKILTRNLSYSSSRASKEKSKVEETINVLKEEKEANTHTHTTKSKLRESHTASSTGVTSSQTPVTAAKPERSIGKRVWDEIVHYYHGFRLLFIDIRVASGLVWKLIRGGELTRRENKVLVRTTSDIFRLVPFSVFILVPFLELTLPLVIKLFPSLLPSTFETKSDKEKKFKSQLKVKIQMAKFLQDTLVDLALQSKGESHSHTAKEFATFFEKIRSSGEQASNEDILKYCKLFEDELTLDNLPRPSLIALCRLLELQPIGTNNLLRFQLRMKLRNLKADDKLIMKEGIDSLTVTELQAACRSRGMRALGIPENRLRSQLNQWLELSLEQEIPPSLLLLSRALYLPENLPAPDQLKATLSTLPDTAATEAKYKIGEIEGKVDNKTKLELIKKEEAAIKKEAEERVQEEEREREKLEKEKEEADKKKIEVLHPEEELIDKAPLLDDKTLIEKTEFIEEQLSKEDFDDIEDALENISNEKKKLLIEKEEIEDLKEDMAEYNEDIKELKDMVLETGHKELRESKAALRLSNKVNKMISKMDNLLDGLTKERQTLQQEIDDKYKEGISFSEEKDNIIGINELVLAIRRIQKVSDDTKLHKIADVLEKMDVDHDGAVEVDHVLKVIELLGKENVKVNTKQMEEIIDLLVKEDTLELEEKTKKKKLLDENMSPDQVEKKEHN